MEKFILTIAREYGSGGRLIGEALAKSLNVPFYDKAIISLAARECGLAESTIEQNDQKISGALSYGLFTTVNGLPVSDQVFLAQSQVIREVSEKQSCIIVGRCADYILCNDPRCIRTFIHAPLAQRVNRIRELGQITEDDLEAYIRKKDKARAAYYEHFTGLEWGRAQNYHLTVDSSIGLDTTVDLLSELVRKRKI